jgi:hypothetical protein
LFQKDNLVCEQVISRFFWLAFSDIETMLYKQDELDAGGNMSAGIKLIPN